MGNLLRKRRSHERQAELLRSPVSLAPETASTPMSLPDLFSYQFYPVGQGLFASGALRKSDEDEACFLWVYDCGTSSSPELVTMGIQMLATRAGKRQRIDLLVLSHFDHDHISGVSQLIEGFEIGTLMLPYMPLAQRMVIAFEENSGGTDDAHTVFYLNPVSFLLARGGPGIERIVLVPPSGPDGPELQGGSPDNPEDGERPDLTFERAKFEDSIEVHALVQAGKNSGKKTEVAFFPPGSSMKLRSYWEFVPYNDDLKAPLSPEFVALVNADREMLLSVAKDNARSSVLTKLKNDYDLYFGKGSKARNVISLFLYSGPVYPSWRMAWLDRARTQQRGVDDRMTLGQHPASPPLLDYGMVRCSILYSGDGYLNEPPLLTRLINFLSGGRVRRTGVFQVMHHGSERNWHSGVAAAISPLFSVFSSNPERKNWWHPHAAVLRDFWPFGAAQVDEKRDFQVWGILEAHGTTPSGLGRPFSSTSYCPKCWSEDLVRELMPDPENHENYHVIHCRACGWCDWTQ